MLLDTCAFVWLDRLIVAAALVNKMPVLTPDTWIRQYPAEVIWS